MKIPTGDFVLRGGDSSFADRQKNLFDQLSQAERNCHKDQSTTDYPDLDTVQFRRPPPPGKRRRSETRQFKGRESIFKRPDLPSPFADRSVPDYVRNPHKWAKYSLADVSNEDMSERSNTQAALSFLNALRARRLKEEAARRGEATEVDEGPSTSRVSFKKPLSGFARREALAVVSREEKPVFRGSKIVLPEYVIGQKPVKRTRERKNVEKIDRTKQMRLQHLEESDESDE